MSIESFKSFVRTKPSLVNLVSSGNYTWQKLYEIYALYGENSSVWNNLSTPSVTLKDMFNTIKNIDVSEVQNSINSLQKGIKYVEDFVKTKEKSIPVSNYKPRPLYKYFDD